MIQRYDQYGTYVPEGIEPDPDGDYVLYDDHSAAIAAKDAEILRLREMLLEVQRELPVVNFSADTLRDCQRRISQALQPTGDPQ